MATGMKLFGRSPVSAALLMAALALTGGVVGLVAAVVIPAEYEARQTYIVSVDEGVEQTIAASTQLVEQRARTYAAVSSTSAFTAQAVGEMAVDPSAIEVEGSYVPGTALFTVVVRAADATTAESVREAISTGLRTTNGLGAEVATSVQAVGREEPALHDSRLRELVPLGAVTGLVIALVLLALSERRTASA